MAIKLAEQTNGPHIFMRLRLDSGRVEEIDAYTTEKGWRYVNNAKLQRIKCVTGMPNNKSTFSYFRVAHCTGKQTK